ncbi:hypothetical protein D3C77_657610 [compost metagenome]
MKAHAALERADGRAVLDAESAVHLGLAPVIGPAHAELDDPFRLNQALKQGVVGVVRVLFDERPQAMHDLLDGLHELGLLRVARGDATQEVVQTLHFQHDFLGGATNGCVLRHCGARINYSGA